MNEDKKYFWLKLKRDFFKRHDIEIIESMPNGEKYVLFYLKLLTESIDHEGRLRFSDTIPYKDTMLATITRTDIDVVRSAIKIFTELKMMEIFDDDTLYMSQIEDMLGSATVWAEKKRVYRENQKQIEDKTSEGQLGGQKEDMSDKSKRLDIEKDIEKDIELDSEIEKEEDKMENPSLEEKKVYPENKKEYLPEFLKVWAKIERVGIFTLKLYRKGTDNTPVSEGLTAQEMLLSLLNGTFVDDWFVHVSEKQKPDLKYLQDMSWERIVTICSNPTIKEYTREPCFKDFLLNLHNTRRINYSQILSWLKPKFGTATSNCNTNIPNVIIPDNIKAQFTRIKAFPRFKTQKDDVLINNLIFLDKYQKDNYLIIYECSRKNPVRHCGSLEAIIDGFFHIMENWEGKWFDEGFFEYGKWGWNKYVKNCDDEGVVIEPGEMAIKNMLAERKRKQMQAELDKGKKDETD